MVFYDKFVKLCSAVGKTPSAVAVEIGIGKSNVTYWKAGRNNPSDVTIAKIADYFGVSIEELKCVEEQKKTVTIESDGLDELDMKFISMIKQLSEQEKRMLLAQMEALIQLRGQ